MSLKPTDKRVIIANLEGQLSKNKVIVVIHVQTKYGMHALRLWSTKDGSKYGCFPWTLELSSKCGQSSFAL